jgi:hypothetical protein
VVICAVGDLMGIGGGISEEGGLRLARCATVHRESAVRGSLASCYVGSHGVTESLCNVDSESDKVFAQ